MRGVARRAERTDGPRVYLLGASGHPQRDRVARIIEHVVTAPVDLVEQRRSRGIDLFGDAERSRPVRQHVVVLLGAPQLADELATRDAFGWFCRHVGPAHVTVLAPADVILPQAPIGYGSCEVNDGPGWWVPLAERLQDSGFEVRLEQLMHMA